jgi:hypothetical protein
MLQTGKDMHFPQQTRRKFPGDVREIEDLQSHPPSKNRIFG